MRYQFEMQHIILQSKDTYMLLIKGDKLKYKQVQTWWWFIVHIKSEQTRINRICTDIKSSENDYFYMSTVCSTEQQCLLSFIVDILMFICCKKNISTQPGLYRVMIWTIACIYYRTQIMLGPEQQCECRIMRLTCMTLSQRRLNNVSSTDTFIRKGLIFPLQLIMIIWTYLWMRLVLPELITAIQDNACGSSGLSETMSNCRQQIRLVRYWDTETIHSSVNFKTLCYSIKKSEIVIITALESDKETI